MHGHASTWRWRLARLPPGLWDVVNDRVIADANMVQLFSLSTENAADAGIETYLLAIHPADRERVAAKLREAVETLTDFQAEFRIGRNQGQVRWFDARGRIERDQVGKAVSVPGVIVDVTERRLAEENLRQSEEFNRSIVESSSDCVKVLDLEGRLLAMNANGCRLMEIDDFSHCINQSWQDYWPAEGRELARSALEAARQGEAASFQGFCPTAKGTGKWWDVAVTPIFSSEGQTERILAVSRDISAAKRSEEVLKSQSVALTEADQHKDEFIAMLAHELRNPLAAIGNAGNAHGDDRRQGAHGLLDGFHPEADQTPVAVDRRPARRIPYHTRQDRTSPRNPRRDPGSRQRCRDC